MSVFPKKPQLITRQILPVLWDILGNMTTSGAIPGGSGNLRIATKALVMSLYDFMGKDLMQEASSLPQRSRTALDGLLNSWEKPSLSFSTVIVTSYIVYE